MPLMTPGLLHTLIFGWMLALSPPDRDAARPTFPEAVETAEDRTFRYTEIAADIVRAVDSLPLASQKGAAELLVAIAFHESGFRKDVDLGPCAPAWVKKGGCDHGRSVSMWQLQPWDPPVEGRREAAAREALRRAFRSMSACRGNAAEERLALYAGSETCKGAMARQRSREIWSVLRKIRALRDVKGTG